ncbi:MAG: ammonium transporter, partial [Flavobacteriaceae bacterium]
WGTLAVGVFGANQGLEQVGIQAAVIGVAGIFCCIGAAIIVLLVKALVGLRVSEAEEAEGLDIAEHGTSAYADFSVK